MAFVTQSSFFPLLIELDLVLQVPDVSQPHARKLHIALGRDGLACVRKLGVPPCAVDEKGESALLVIEHQRPINHLASRVDDADALGCGLGAVDLAVEPTLLPGELATA